MNSKYGFDQSAMDILKPLMIEPDLREDDKGRPHITITNMLVPS